MRSNRVTHEAQPLKVAGAIPSMLCRFGRAIRGAGLIGLLCVLSWNPSARSAPEETGSEPASSTGDSVFIAIYIIDVLGVDDVRQSASIDLVLTQSRYDVNTVSADDLTPEQLAQAPDVPPLFITNGDGVDIKWEGVLPSLSGVPMLVKKMVGRFTVPMDFREFPIDRQELVIEFITPANVTMIPDNIRSGRRDTMSIPNWEIGQGAFHQEKVKVMAAELPGLQYRLPAQRLAGFYTWKVIIPLLMIVLMAGGVFWIDPSHIAPQISLAATSMLTMIAYRFAVSVLVPQIPYLTRLDRFTSAASLLILGALLQAVLTSNLSGRGNLAAARKIDVVSRWIYGVAIVFVVARVFWF
jgi:hypothetical protein